MNKTTSNLDTTTLQKVTLRHVYIEIGRACNLACEHCCKGESQNVRMSDEVMDALLDNVFFIDEITITGGEPLLYIERMRTLLNKCKARNIKVNYFNVISNCTIRSEEMVSLLNDWIDYCTFGDKNELTISTDKYHELYLHGGIFNGKIYDAKASFSTNVKANVEWYRKHLKPCVIQFNGSYNLDYSISIFNEGRVREWSKDRKKHYALIQECSRVKTLDMQIPVNELCEGETNVCGYGCVHNCVRNIIYLNPYGKLFTDSFSSFELQDTCEDVCVGSILEDSIYNLIKKWNEEVKKSKEVHSQIKIKNEVFDMLIERFKRCIDKANEFCCEAKYPSAKKNLEAATACYKAVSDEYKSILSGFTFAYDNAKKAGATSDEMAYQQMAIKHNIPYEHIILCSEFLEKLRLAVEEMESIVNTASYVLAKREELKKSGNILREPDNDMDAGIGILGALFGAGMGIAALIAGSKSKK